MFLPIGPPPGANCKRSDRLVFASASASSAPPVSGVTWPRSARADLAHSLSSPRAFRSRAALVGDRLPARWRASGVLSWTHLAGAFADAERRWRSKGWRSISAAVSAPRRTRAVPRPTTARFSNFTTQRTTAATHRTTRLRNLTRGWNPAGARHQYRRPRERIAGFPGVERIPKQMDEPACGYAVSSS
jgi:hypothetical protein